MMKFKFLKFKKKSEVEKIFPSSKNTLSDLNSIGHNLQDFKVMYTNFYS